MAVKTSPLAPTSCVTLPAIDGVRIATAEAGIKYAGRADLMLMVFDRPAAVAGVFTRSQCASAPVEWCRRYLDGGMARALVVNSGNANAFTGLKGEQAARQTAEAAADAVGCLPGEVFLSSTGVIGEPLAADRFTGLLGDMEENARAERWPDAASAIMTTDTFAKLATRRAKISGRDVTLNGIAKGSGMIAPDMATMLAYVVTDAPVPAEVLQVLLNRAVSTSFNAITVDGDTSTSDTLMAFALPPPGSLADREPAIEDPDDERLAEFHEALKSLTLDLALQIVRDGEGASKFVEIRVTGATSDQSARTIALSVANSPLVKTAIAGEDANWGRIVMAVGKAGEPADRDRLSIWFGDVQVAREGERDPDYSEDKAAAVMTGQEIVIRVDLGLGDGEFRAYTCDLTHDYITINADYRS